MGVRLRLIEGADWTATGVCANRNPVQTLNVNALQLNSVRGCELEELTSSAQRELGAFLKAVIDSFGSEQAQLAAEDWSQELNATPPAELSARTWRALTIASSVRLASRLNTTAQNLRE